MQPIICEDRYELSNYEKLMIQKTTSRSDKYYLIGWTIFVANGDTICNVEDVKIEVGLFVVFFRTFVYLFRLLWDQGKSVSMYELADNRFWQKLCF